MADIFVSYKKEDRVHAERLSDRLRAEGFSVWWDDDIQPRQAWDATIEQEISAATSVVVLWSPLAVTSDWVRTEAHYGHQRGRLVPVIIERCQLPLAFSLTQTLDLCGWNGDATNRHWLKLLTWVADLKTSAAAPAAGATAPINPYRTVVGKFASGEPIVDGALVNLAAPAGTLFQDHPDAPVMRIVPRGDFLLGAAPVDPDRTSVEGPQKHVSIDHPFAIGVFPVTNAQYRRFAPAAAPPEPPPPPSGLTAWFGGRKAAREAPAPPAGPAEVAANRISFEQAQDFATILSRVTGGRYRLPSEAEWEYACRAGSRSRFSWGDEIDPSRALYGWPGADNRGPSAPGRFGANAFGLYDMHGNLREWTEDSWQETHDLAPSDGRPVAEGLSSMRVTRGGGWSDPAAMLRSSARSRATQTIRSEVIGLRVVRVLY